jgi:hypothetical protein
MRGASIKEELIGHTVYGDLDGKRYKWSFNITDKSKAESAGVKLGMKNVKAYALYSNNPLTVPNDGSNKADHQEGCP